MSSLLMERTNAVLTAHTEWLPGVQLRHFSPICAVHIEDCEGWWLTIVVAQWQSISCTSQLSWVRFPATAGLFTFLYFCLITSKFLFFFYLHFYILLSLHAFWHTTFWSLRSYEPLFCTLGIKCYCNTVDHTYSLSIVKPYTQVTGVFGKVLTS